MISLSSLPQDVSVANHERADAAARQLVGQAFLVPLLKEVRESTAGHGVFSPGAAERRFGPILDHQMADTLMTRLDLDLVTQVRQSMLNREAQVAEVKN